MEAERVAPQTLRYNVLVRELLREMLKRERRTATPGLRSLAQRAGVLQPLTDARRVAYVIGFSAPPVLHLHDFIALLRERDWDPYVILSPTAATWVDIDLSERGQRPPGPRRASHTGRTRPASGRGRRDRRRSAYVQQPEQVGRWHQRHTRARHP